MRSLRFAILTVSDRSARGDRPDSSGPALQQRLQEEGWQVTQRAVVPDEQQAIEALLVSWCDGDQFDVIITTGGTGFSPRDVTPEATLAIIDRQAPGLAEAMRLGSFKATAYAMLSRAVAGIRRNTLIVNMPGSPKGALENLEIILPVLTHAVELLRSDPDSEAGHQRL